MKYVKKPVVIEAVQFDGLNILSVMNFLGKSMEALQGNDQTNEVRFVIQTLEGNMIASKGDWIIKGIAGEFYPCKPDIFAATYDLVSGQ